jgi:FdhD protein
VSTASKAGAEQRPVRHYPPRKNAMELDSVAVEEPLQISLAWPAAQQPVAITMRTPGHDAELALGFLFGEGVLGPDTTVTNVTQRRHEQEGNEVIVHLAAAPPAERLPQQRQTYMTSSCGICGKAAIEAIRLQSDFPLGAEPFTIAADTLTALPAQLSRGQALFAGTGSIHAAALFTMTGAVGKVYEDVGRHNALDKLIGAAFAKDFLPLWTQGVLVSGRASFELVQKARMAGIPMLAAVGAPSSLAIDLAWECDMTLVGFLRDGRCNVYSAPDRVTGMS